MNIRENISHPGGFRGGILLAKFVHVEVKGQRFFGPSFLSKVEIERPELFLGPCIVKF